MIGILKAHLEEGQRRIMEKRLLCLARALLGKAGVLLVEEAHPDSESECLLQQLVRTHLPECTVLWLTCMYLTVSCDHRVLVLDAGHPVEFDSPSVLLQQGKLFRQLLRESQRGVLHNTDGG
ncbi:multidrug resistance-associated protein 1-like isoform X1 [Astyanax mexicanus]|uniref:Multidrug resistance-associated protein 1-like isoform X1 n=1 Tax=Astyanax mexicanus TaxID=7994 RepID=A0A8T2MFY8_ASTMX|nr:multidrug resistance-associated protein 1-like isoform X1 [Astyanax mexicanus]